MKGGINHKICCRKHNPADVRKTLTDQDPIGKRRGRELGARNLAGYREAV
jgi:hypothetical protein